MTLTFLGTGTSTGVPTLACHCAVCESADPRDKRTRPSVLVEFDGRAVVIDTSPDFRGQALREKLERLDAVLFTHDHVDHVMGLDDVRVYCFRQDQAIPIYADAGVMASLRRIFAYVFDQTYPYGGIPKLDPHRDDPVDHEHPCLLVHGLASNCRTWESVAERLHAFGHPVAAVDQRGHGRSDKPPEGYDYATLCRDLLLVLDALRHKPHPSHSTVEQSLAWVERLKPRRAFFTHIAHELGHEATNATLPPNVRLAYDGLKLELGGRAAPTFESKP